MKQERDELPVVVDLMTGKKHQRKPPPGWVLELKAIVLSKQALRAAGVLVALVALRLGVNWLSEHGQVAALPRVETVHPQVAKVDVTLNLPGNLEALQQANLFAHVGGYLKKLHVDEGDTVKKGQLLAEIDAPDVVQEFHKAKAGYDFKETTRKRYEELLKERVVSQQEYDTVDADANESKARYENASANLGYTRITAPFAGAIARRFKYPGDLISQATKSGDQPIFVLVNESELRVVVNIPQSDLSNIRVGDTVEISIQGQPGHEALKIPGHVSRMDALLDESTKTQRVLIDLDNSKKQLRAGMFVSVTLHRLGKDGALTLPKESILMEGDKPIVQKVVDGKIKKVSVVTGVSDAERIEVLQGVTGDDAVVRKPGATFTDGLAVETPPAKK